MPSLRDDLLPVANDLRQLPQDFGLRRFAVTIRRRTWSGAYVGAGAPTDQDIVLSPEPRVRSTFSPASMKPETLQYLLAKGTVMADRFYTIDRITPAFVDENGNPGGYSAQQLRLWIPPDVKNVEMIVVLIGDDGFKRDCLQRSVAQDRAFGYSMIVEESDRPRTALTSLAITPSPITVVHGNVVSLTAIGTFSDGSMSDLTSLVVWSSSDVTKATVDLLGKLTGVAAGSATITASLTGVSTTANATVS